MKLTKALRESKQFSNPNPIRMDSATPAFSARHGSSIGRCSSQGRQGKGRVGTEINAALFTGVHAARNQGGRGGGGQVRNMG